MFETVLIANRGEIARRIIRTCRRLGIRSVAVFSEADAEAPFVREADDSVRIGPAPARESYLRVDAILEAARRSGADAIHPGYGFLSENPDLPRACEAAGIVFIGPPADVMEAMGSKVGAKRLAVEAGVPVLPGFDRDTGQDGPLIEAARAVGFPLLVKASAGGGGKGMRAVEHEAELADAIVAARREAVASFGDATLLLERLVRRARHVEIQVAADHHGRVLHLFERDCSVQRNNQKVFEEAPAPNLAEAVRERLTADAVRLAASIGYRNLGTMEFLIDAAEGSHHFLEMNTRLQVEHPVTEMITGLDLVEMQLRIASGEALPPQDEITSTGHAIEARLAAERPEAGYLPATGRIVAWRPPLGVRLDSAVETGSEVTVHYDSMIGKVIAHGPTRETARRRLVRALDDLVVLGPATNRAFLADVARAGPFADGHAVTRTLAESFPDGWRRGSLPWPLAAGIAAALASIPVDAARSGSPWSTLAGFRVLGLAGRPAEAELAVDLDGIVEPARIRIEGPRRTIVMADGPVPIEVERTPEGFSFRLDGDHRRGLAVESGGRLFLRLGAAEWSASVETAVAAHRPTGAAARGADSLVAAMPGTVVEVRVGPGDDVAKDDPLVVLESMKLFLTLRAPRAGRIAAIEASAGATVRLGAVLVTFEPVIPLP